MSAFEVHFQSCRLKKMSVYLDRKVKTALNETRLLILGVQVLLGFQFQSFFQDGFAELSGLSKSGCVAGLGFLVVSIGLLIVPSMEHRIVEVGISSTRLLKVSSFYTSLSLGFITVSLGLASYVVIAQHFGMTTGAASGLLLTGLAIFAWFGLEALIGFPSKEKRTEVSQTSLSTKIEQLLTEARVIIPGAQALFGFQFIAMLTTSFDRLPQTSKSIHAAALGLVAINVILLMMPAALHRLSFDGENSATFLSMASVIVIIAPLFLAAGISAEMYVVIQKAFGNEDAAFIGAFASFVGLIVLWYGIPLAVRRQLKR
jgi:hypothetical protein